MVCVISSSLVLVCMELSFGLWPRDSSLISAVTYSQSCGVAYIVPLTFVPIPVEMLSLYEPFFVLGLNNFGFRIGAGSFGDYDYPVPNPSRVEISLN